MKWALIILVGLLSINFALADISIARPIEWESFTRVTSTPVPVSFAVTNPINCWYEVRGIRNYTGTVSPCNNGYNNFILTIFDDGNYALNIYYLDSENRILNTGVNFTVLPYVFQNTIPAPEPEENETGCCTTLKQFVLSHLYVNNNLTYATTELKDLATLLTQGCNMKIDSYTADRMVRGYNLLCVNITGEIPQFKLTTSSDNSDENFINDGSLTIIIVITLTIVIGTFFLIRKYKKR